jgi:hypothetical protein
MTSEQLQEIFGNEIGRVYSFTDSIPEGSDPQVHITEAFATAAGSNLINCIVTHIFGTWLVYTKESTVTSDKFTLLVELPLPVPEVPEVPEVPAESETQSE